MKLGITYDLRSDYLSQGYTEEETVEFDSIQTIDAIDETLRSLGHTTHRIGHVRNLTRLLAAGERWDLVFNIAEGMHGFGRESQVPALLDAFQIPYTFSDPLVLAAALHKGIAKRLVASFGVPTPNFQVVDDPAQVDAMEFDWPVFAKPVAGGTSAGVSSASKAANRTALKNVCSQLIQRFRQPVLVESFLSGREFTAGVVGTASRARVLGVMEVVLEQGAEADCYSYTNKQNYLTRVSYREAEEPLAARASELALRVWNGLGCRDAGRVDFRCDGQGNLNFLEINPLAGLHPVDSDLIILGRMAGVSHAELIARIVESAAERVPAGAGRGAA